MNDTKPTACVFELAEHSSGCKCSVNDDGTPHVDFSSAGEAFADALLGSEIEQPDIEAVKRNHDLSDWEPCSGCPDAYGNHFSCRKVESCAKCDCSEFTPFSRREYAKTIHSQRTTIERLEWANVYKVAGESYRTCIDCKRSPGGGHASKCQIRDAAGVKAGIPAAPGEVHDD